MSLKSIEQRRAAGRAIREDVPIKAHAEWSAPAHRYPLALLTVRDAARIAWLIGERNGRMAQTPATFLRGAATVMAADLGATGCTTITVQAGGDSHLMNFGAVVSPDGSALFDVNDFDETLRAPFEWDLKRLATSLVVVGGLAGHDGGSARKLARHAARAYADHMTRLAALNPVDAWNSRIRLDHEVAGIDDDAVRAAQQAQLDAFTQAQAKHLNLVSARQPKIAVDGLRVLKMADAERDVVAAAFALYLDGLEEDRRILLSRYAIADIATKIVGIGSVGTLCAIILLATADGAALLLQIKQAEVSALAQSRPASPYDNQGQRVVMGQRLMQAAPDLFLGWMRDATGRNFYVRRLKDQRLAKIGEAIEGAALPFYAALCGRTLARAHARSSDAAVIDGYLGGGEKFCDAIADFAVAYAGQNARDFATFQQAFEAGLIPNRRLGVT